MFIKIFFKIFIMQMLLISLATGKIHAENTAVTYLFDKEAGLAVPDTQGNLDAYLGARDVSSSAPSYSDTVKFPYKNNHSLEFADKGFGKKAFTIPAKNIPSSSSFTLEAWFKPQGKPLQFSRLWARGNLFSLSTKSGKTPGSQRLIWSLNINGKTKNLGTPPEMDIFPNDTDWVHIATSYDSQNGMAKIFVNGTLAVQANLGKTEIVKSDSDLIIGNRAESDRGFVGLIDEFRYSQHSLRPEELAYYKTLFKGDSEKEITFEWENSKCGLDDKVPARWENIKAVTNKDKSVTVIAAGKKFIFSNSILPDKIQYNGLELLSSPVALEKDGISSRKFNSSLKLIKNTAEKAVLEGNLSIKKQSFKGRCEIEFDGLCRITVEPILNSPRPKVSDFKLNFPLNPKLAELGKVGGYAGEIKSKLGKNWTFPLWVGSEKAGLSMFTETNKFWVNPNPKDAFTVAPQKNTVELSANFISAATVFKPDSKFEVFFQPTPIVKFPKERNELGNFHGAFINMEKIPGAVNLSYPTANTLNTKAGSLDIVFEAGFDPNAKMNKRLGREPYIRELFTVGTLGHEKIRLAWSIPHGGFIIDEGIQPSADSIWDGTWKTLLTSKFTGKSNTPYHITMTWGKDKLKLFMDGKLLSECPRNGLFSSPINVDSMGKSTIRLGESVFNFLAPRFGSGFEISAIRIVDHELSSAEIKAPLKKIPGTILFDTFNTVEKSKKGYVTKPEVGEYGHISSGGRIQNNKVQLFQDKNDVKVSCLDRVHESGVNTIIFHQGWSSIQSHYKAEHPKELHELIEACHKKNMKILLYFGFELSEKAPEFKKFHRQALRLNPDRPTPKLYQVRHDQKSQTVCYAGLWQNFITFAINKTLEDFKCDGIYIDAAMVPYPCPNELHGCGWRDSSGKLHATQPIYNYLKMMRRIHKIVKSKGGIITGNQATFPLWPYCDSVWMGEGYRYKQLGANPVKGIPLPQWRILFNGENLGMPGELLMYEYPKNWRRDAAWMLAGLHNMYVRPEIWWTGAYLEKVLAIRKAIKKYAPGSSEYIPYWSNQVPAVSDSKDVLISAWKSTEGILFWIGNLSEKQIKSRISFKQEISTKIQAKAIDPIFKNEYAIKKNQVSISLEPFNFRLLYVKFKNQ